MNMSVRTLRLSAVILPAVMLTACGGDHDSPRSSRGPAISEQREVSDFKSISLRGSAQLQVQIGEPASLMIEGDEESVRRLETEVSGDTLEIRTSRKDWPLPGRSSRLVLKVTVPELDELRLSGGNDVRLAGLDGGETTIEIEGAANLTAKGRLDELVVRMEGAGHADLRDLVARDAEVTVDGVGSVYVNSTESLDATMNGVGAILYSGTPHEVNTSMRGVGTISKDREREDSEREDSDANPEPSRKSEPQLERDDRKPQIDPETLQPEYEV